MQAVDEKKEKKGLIPSGINPLLSVDLNLSTFLRTYYCLIFANVATIGYSAFLTQRNPT